MVKIGKEGRIRIRFRDKIVEITGNGIVITPASEEREYMRR